MSSQTSPSHLLGISNAHYLQPRALLYAHYKSYIPSLEWVREGSCTARCTWSASLDVEWTPVIVCGELQDDQWPRFWKKPGKEDMDVVLMEWRYLWTSGHVKVEQKGGGWKYSPFLQWSLSLADVGTFFCVLVFDQLHSPLQEDVIPASHPDREWPAGGMPRSGR